MVVIDVTKLNVQTEHAVAGCRRFSLVTKGRQTSQSNRRPSAPADNACRAHPTADN